MLDSLNLKSHIGARIKSGPLGPYIEPYIELLEREGYSRSVVRRHIRGIDVFTAWLSEHKISADEIDSKTFEQFAGLFSRRPSLGRPRGLQLEIVGWVRKLVNFLWDCGVSERTTNAKPLTETDNCLQSFDKYLDSVKGLSPGTRRTYLRYARAFLARNFNGTSLKWSKIGADNIVEFVRSQVEKLNPSASRAPVTATRTFLRYLSSRGKIPCGLDHAVPTIRQWKQSALPSFMSDDEVERILSSCCDQTSIGLRNRAIIFLLARLGLRASEVTGLYLEDIDWRHGHISIQAKKSGHERRLPLPADAGEAVVLYLQRGRPQRPHRAVFLTSRPPYCPLSPGAITYIAKQALKLAGVCTVRSGAHVFRHSAATRMVRKGAPFKNIADVLGHARLETTAIYAKLNVEILAQVALPWPGGVQ